MTVSAIVVSHGHARELESSLPALAPQVDELVVISNVPGSVGKRTTGARVLENAHPVPFAANVNRGVAETSGELGVISTPDAYPEPGADDPRWLAVDLAPLEKLARPVTLAEIKAQRSLAKLKLVTHSRLSVMPVDAAAFERILALARTQPKR